MTNPDFADALETQRGRVSEVELDRHVNVKNGLASARYLVELVESFLNVTWEDLRGNEEVSDAAAFSAGPSPHEDCLAEDAFVDDVRGGVLESDGVKQPRRKEVHMDAEGSKAVSLRWIDTNSGDARLQTTGLDWS